MAKELRLIKMSNVEVEEIKWLWHPYIPQGKVTIIQGDPGEGKTTFVLAMIALLTKGEPLPEHEIGSEPISVIYQTAEDGLGDTIKPRLLAAGADCERVLVIDESETELTLSDERLEKAIRETGAKLIVLDPLQAYLGGDVDMHRANEVRPVFKRLCMIAEETGCAIILIGHMNKTQGAKSSYRKALEKVYPIIGHIKLCKLRPITLENMCIELRKRQWRGKSIKETTVQKYLTTVSAVLRDAKKNEIIQKNPARMIDLPDTEKVQQVIPTDHEAKEIISLLLDEALHFKIFYVLAIYTGCRRGELCALKWSDIIIQNGMTTMVVSRSRSSLPGCGVVEGKTKNGKERTIILNDCMTDILRSYCWSKSQEAESHGEELGEYLFTNELGQLLHPDTFSKRLRKIYDRNGFPKEFHLHTLRHYFVSTMLHNGVDKQTVAELAGHDDTSFLERTYCHPQTTLKQKAAVALSNNLFGGSAYVDEQGKEQAVRIA